MKVKDLKAFIDRFGEDRGQRETVLYNEGTEWSPSWKPLNPNNIKVEIKPTLQPETSEEEA